MSGALVQDSRSPRNTPRRCRMSGERWRGIVQRIGPLRRNGEQQMHVSRRTAVPTFGAVVDAMLRAAGAGPARRDNRAFEITVTGSLTSQRVLIQLDDVTQHPIAARYDPMDGLQAQRYRRAYARVVRQTRRVVIARIRLRNAALAEAVICATGPQRSGLHSPDTYWPTLTARFPGLMAAPLELTHGVGPSQPAAPAAVGTGRACALPYVDEDETL